MPSPGPSIRLYLASPLAPLARHICTAEQTNYLASVLRLDTGSGLLVFNELDGEWLARIAELGSRALILSRRWPLFRP